MDDSSKAFNREADRYMNLMEEIQARCQGEFLNQSDFAIAAQIEQEFGISGTFILEEFNAEYSLDYNTAELVMKAYEKDKQNGFRCS